MRDVRGIYLVGFSGCGKSTAAKLAGAGLGWPAYDLDDKIEQHSGRAIPEIFAQEGEAGFRRRETEALRSISETGRFVVATGGGTFLSQENRELMAAKGWTICLEARPETILARIQNHLAEGGVKAVRPLLDAPDPLEKIRTLKASRQPIYSLADWTINTDRLSAGQIAQEIIRAHRLLEGVV